MGVLPVISDTFAGLCGDNLPGGIVSAVEHHASRLRTEVIEQLSDSRVS